MENQSETENGIKADATIIEEKESITEKVERKEQQRECDGWDKVPEGAFEHKKEQKGSFAIDEEEMAEKELQTEKEMTAIQLKTAELKLLDRLCIAINKLADTIGREGCAYKYEKISNETAEEAKQYKMSNRIADMFPLEVRQKLTFTEDDEKVTCAFGQKVDSDIWKKAFDIVKKADGTYVSAGKNSHFEIPKK